MAGITVVIIDKDTESISAVQKYIRNLGDSVSVEGVATNYEHGYELILKKKPLVVLLELDEKNMEHSLDEIKALMNRFPQTSIFATSKDQSSETILKVMRAGATEYLLRPITEVDLSAALQKVGRLWIVKTKPEAEIGTVYTVFSPKGGVGVTTMATNLATNIYEATKKPTIIVDLDLEAGDVSTFLNLKPSYTITDVTLNITKLDKSYLQGVISKHDSGVFVLAEAQKVEEGASISGANIRKVLSLLKTMFDYIIVDTEPVMDERTVSIVEMSNMLLLVFIMSLPGIKNMQRYLGYFEKKGFGRERLKLVVNRFMKKSEIKVEDAEKILNYPAFWKIPNDYETAISCLNKGVPISTEMPRSDYNKAVKDMTKILLESSREGRS